jgi:serine/threonine protein kinase
MDNDAGNGEF